MQATLYNDTMISSSSSIHHHCWCTDGSPFETDSSFLHVCLNFVSDFVNFRKTLSPKIFSYSSSITIFPLLLGTESSNAGDHYVGHIVGRH